MSYDGYSLEPAIQDVCVICAGKNEQPPEGFTLVRKSLNTRALALKVLLRIPEHTSQASPRRITSACNSWCVQMNLAVRRAMPVGLCDLPFESQVVDRFPVENYFEFPLPEPQVSMFCFPDGLKLKRAPAQSAPSARFFSYVMTDEKVYACCNISPCRLV